MSERIERAADALADADHAVAFTGAGVSTASGIPDFRSDGGIWETFEPSDFRYNRFRADPSGFWTDRVEMHEAVYGGDIEPNEAHEALATMEEHGTLDTVITQNIDGLHTEAGSETVIELHGNADRVVCEDCGKRFDAGPVWGRIKEGDVPPRCHSCDGIVKPDVVLFGEQLPGPVLQRAREHAREADVFLAAGSSLSVEPAASLPRMATRGGGQLIVVNLEKTPASERATHDFRADVTEILPALASRVRHRKE